MIPNALLNEKKRRDGGRRREKGEGRMEEGGGGGREEEREGRVMEEGGGSAYGNEKEKTFVLIHEFSSANRAVNAGQDFSVKFHQWVHGTFDFFISDLDKFTLKTKTKKIIQIIEGFDGVLKSTLKLPFNQKKKEKPSDKLTDRLTG